LASGPKSLNTSEDADQGNKAKNQTTHYLHSRAWPCPRIRLRTQLASQDHEVRSLPGASRSADEDLLFLLDESRAITVGRIYEDLTYRRIEGGHGSPLLRTDLSTFQHATVHLVVAIADAFGRADLAEGVHGLRILNDVPCLLGPGLTIVPASQVDRGLVVFEPDKSEYTPSVEGHPVHEIVIRR
jgi:hypothetical protein